jgi:hypothetical protein
LFLHGSESDGNTALGARALRATFPGSFNTAVGFEAFTQSINVSFGGSNTAVGYQALRDNRDGFHNVAVGSRALATNIDGQRNTAIGGQSQFAAGTADDNTSVGHRALEANSSSPFNVAVGAAALMSTTSGGNTALGFCALCSQTTGGGNTAIGRDALFTLTTGAGNIAIGPFAGSSAPTNISNSIMVGNLGSGVSSGSIVIGNSTNHTKAFVAGIAGVTVANSAAVLIDTTTGQLGTVASSRRYKQDVAPMGDVSEMLTKLRPVTFQYKPAHDDGARELQYGLIAEEVADVMPYLTVFNKEGQPETVKYHLLPSFLLAGYQLQQSTIAALSERDKQRTEKIEALEERLRRLEALLPQTRAALRQ